MIDIVRDYTAIGMGNTQATTARLAGAAGSGVRWITTWGHPEQGPDLVGPGDGLRAPTTSAPTTSSAGVQGDGCILGRLRAASEVRLLRDQVQRLERHIADLRGDQ